MAAEDRTGSSGEKVCGTAAHRFELVDENVDQAREKSRDGYRAR